ncbi:hypothetical protein Pint_12950 [Pistacia integerrima]|uniref:Uncharacterized protein n=1 Tax=Pistacia integerrima TaxID=434235 RepID=A0ACC0YBG2_9ROSI|nr:hypothetical protein Pint_12950 [Pistacia integerrima]
MAPAMVLTPGVEKKNNNIKETEEEDLKKRNEELDRESKKSREREEQTRVELQKLIIVMSQLSKANQNHKTAITV